MPTLPATTGSAREDGHLRHKSLLHGRSSANGGSPPALAEVPDTTSRATPTTRCRTGVPPRLLALPAGLARWRPRPPQAMPRLPRRSRPPRHMPIVEPLTNDTGAADADCRPHRNLPSPHRTARQKNAGDVRAVNHQHDGNDSHPDRKEDATAVRSPAGIGEAATARHSNVGGTTPAGKYRVSDGNSRASAAPMDATSSDACSREIPGFKRPPTIRVLVS